MYAAGSRPATPTLAQVLEISVDHACQTGKRTALGRLRAPQSLVLSSMIDRAGHDAHDQPHHLPASNRHRPHCTPGALPFATSCIVGLPTPAEGSCACGRDGRHPQTFTTFAGPAGLGAGRCNTVLGRTAPPRTPARSCHKRAYSQRSAGARIAHQFAQDAVCAACECAEP
jgi:hypothetical protein